MAPRVEQQSSVLKAFAWSEPIIADVLHRHYPQQREGSPANGQLLPRHLQFWKALIFGSEAVSRKQRSALVAAASEAGLDMAFLSSVDDEVMTELLEVVLRRFRGMPDEARKYHLLLMSIAGRLRISALPDNPDGERSRHFGVPASRSRR